jgi:NAD(P)-dependent dehydrogenase (short-subunit alcohol dehydrogenase family)
MATARHESIRSARLLDGKVAIVTGAGRGVGRAEAEHLAASGARLVVNGLDGERIEALAQQINADGGKALAFAGDVSDWDTAEQLIATAIEEFGQLDVLVNNAGIVRDAMSFSMTEQAWDDVVRVNLKGHFAPAHFAAAHWRAVSKKRSRDAAPLDARIINTTSEAGLYGLTGQINYVATKAGIAAMTLSLSKELSPYGVLVNAVAPRARTEMTTEVFLRLGLPLEPPLQGFDEWAPENIAPFVTWLASGHASRISGKVFVVFGNEISVLAPWHIESTIRTAHAWTADELSRWADVLPAAGRRPEPHRPARFDATELEPREP